MTIIEFTAPSALPAGGAAVGLCASLLLLARGRGAGVSNIRARTIGSRWTLTRQVSRRPE